MVICSECGTRVKPKVTACPKCGAPVDATNAGPRREDRSIPWVAMIAIAFAAFIAATGLFLVLR